MSNVLCCFPRAPDFLGDAFHERRTFLINTIRILVESYHFHFDFIQLTCLDVVKEEKV